MIKTQMTVDEAVCETLSQYGVEYVFGMRIYTDLDTSRTRVINIHYDLANQIWYEALASTLLRHVVCAGKTASGMRNALAIGATSSSINRVPAERRFELHVAA